MDNIFNKRCKILILILIITILLTIIKYFAENIVLYAYHHPMTNTQALSYLSPEVKHLNKVLEDAKYTIGNDKYKIEYLYKNYYGSGFLKYNPAPNDLDCSVGVYLGEFDYNGNNSNEVALSVLSKISIFYTAFFETLSNNFSDKLYTTVNPLDSMKYGNFDSESNIYSFKYALPKVFEGNEYIYMLKKSPFDMKDVKMNVPFLMNKTEVLIENMAPLSFYSTGVKYNNEMNNYVRELSIIFDFFVDVKDVKTGKVVRVELVPEAFTGARMQISRRLFVPSVFSGIDSVLYLNNFEYLNDEKLYLKNRFVNMQGYLDVVQYNKDNLILPIKLLKRLHQAIDAFLPLLDEAEAKLYYDTVSGYLNDKNIVAINDIQNIFNILHSIANNYIAIKHYKYNGQLAIISSCFDKDLHILKKSGLFNKDDLLTLDSREKELIEKMYSVKSESDIENVRAYMASYALDNYYVLRRLYERIIDIDKLIVINNKLKDNFLNAGFKRDVIYWLDKDNVGMIKNTSMNGISENELKKIAVDSGLPNVNYKFIKLTDIDNLKNVHSNVWIRLNPTAEQDKYYEHMKTALLDDRKNYSIKMKFNFVP